MNKKITVLCVCLVLAVSAVARGMAYDAAKGLGQDSLDRRGAFRTHRVCSEFPLEGVSLYNVRVNGSYVGLYNDVNYQGGLVHFGSFEMKNSRPVTIDISYAERIRTFEILPIRQLQLLSVERTSAHSVRIRLDRADQNLTLVVNGELQRHVLHLFCNSFDVERPDVPERSGMQRFEDKKLIYFGPGYYDLASADGNDQLVPPDGWTVYLDAGAVVKGRIHVLNCHWGTCVLGRGMLFTTLGRVVFEINQSEGIGVRGVLFHGHRAQCWQVAIGNNRNVEFKNVKILATRYASTDGLDIVNCEQCAFLNVFIRANDDAITIKGLSDQPPAKCKPNRNLTFCGLQLWNDCNNAFTLGAESHASLYENIRVMNSAILYSYDDPDYHERLDERAAMSICCLHGTYYRNISFENIDVYHCQRLMAFGFQPSFWFGSLKGDQSTPGGIDGLTFQDIYCPNNSGSHIANKIHLYGWHATADTPAKWVENVHFKNVTIEGRKVLSTTDPAFSETDWTTVRQVTFEP